jgi:hypothetical protein
MWSEEIGNLIRCRVSQDFDRLCAEYEPRFLQALEAGFESPGTKRLLKLLANVGLRLTFGHIAIVDDVKWRAVSMIERITARLPSTSNALESFHGHGNEQTPRRNEFVPAIIRVADMMIRKTLSFPTALADSFGRVVRLSRRREKYGDPPVLESESVQYGTTLDYCGCGETCHLAAMYRTACPCSHQYRMKADKPPFPDTRLDLSAPTSSLTIELEQESRVAAVPFSLEQDAKWRNYAVKEIKRFSFSRKTAEIVAYVDLHFQVGNAFVLGRPVLLFGLISDGIAQFTAK